MLLAVLWATTGCQRDAALLAPPEAEVDQPYAFFQPSNFPPADIPPDNKLTVNRVELGRLLFFDPVLSRDSTISCGTCHLPTKAFTDGLALSTGIDGLKTARNAPPLHNLAFLVRGYNWDGGTRTLELQHLVPLENHNEMDQPVLTSVERLMQNPFYVERFQKAYGAEPSSGTLTKALAAYIRSLVSAGSRYDLYKRTGSSDYLSDAELRGMQVFNSERGDCFHCHNTDLFTDHSFQNNASTPDNPDLGRGAVTQIAADNGKFKVPSLRNVELTAPYMHNGSLLTLEDVIEHYNRGGFAQNPTKDPLMRPLNLTTQEKQDLIAFLKALTDEDFILRHSNDSARP